jgi:hypothetical protein
MTLEEVVYQINGKIKVEELEAENGKLHTITLLDNTGEAAVVNFCLGDHRPQTEASVTGKTLDEARQKLAELLRGNILLHDFPVMWKTHTTSLRIPKTLVA